MPMKRFVKLLTVIAFVFILLIAGIYLFSGFFKSPFDNESNIVLVSKFTWEKFEAVEIGTSKSEILDNFGEPYWIRPFGGGCYQYTKGGKIKFFIFDYTKAEICFDENEKVIGTNVFN